MHILIICSLDTVRTHSVSILKDAGHDVSEAANLADAVGIALARTVDAAIIGPGTSPADETDMIQGLRAQNLWFPLIAVSRCECWSHLSDLLVNGADDFIQEPFATSSLLHKLDKLLHNNATRQPRELRLNAEFGSIRVHNLGKQVFINDAPAEISTYDYLTLKCIAQKLGEDGLSPQTLLSQQAQRGCGIRLAEAAEHLLQRIHP